MRNERRPTAVLTRLRDAKLRRLVRHAYDHVPFYRRLSKRHGVSPEDIRTAEDLPKLPVIDKLDLKAQPLADLISDRSGSTDDLILLSTSGSSGVPLELFIDRDYDALRKAQSLRPYLSGGRRLSDRSAYLTGFPNQKPKWFEHLGILRERRIDCGAPHTEQLRALNELRPEVIQGYPSALSSLAAYIRDHGQRSAKPRLIFTDSELLLAESRALIEKTFCAPVIDVFGTWETGNIAYQCDRQSGYHIAIDCVVLELIANDGSPAGDGEEGEIVCTVLDNLTMPLIRYNLHDLATYAGDACGCHRSFPLLKVIAGRAADTVHLADGRAMSSQAFLAPFNFLSEAIKEFQIIQEAVDRFRIVVVAGPPFDAAASERIQGILSARCPGAQVRLDAVDHIERDTSGKLRSFRSLVPG
jgi:phenylacetate-CoA ligase